MILLISFDESVSKKTNMFSCILFPHGRPQIPLSLICSPGQRMSCTLFCPAEELLMKFHLFLQNSYFFKYTLIIVTYF